jgi:hypothetical protein
MANLLHSTRFKSPTTAATPFSVTIPSTAAGSKLVCISGGGAIITAKLGVGGTSFTKRTTSLDQREVSAQDIVDSTGGTTTIQISLNGPENVDGVIFEFASGSLGNFIAGANQGGASSSLDTDWQIGTQSITTSSAAVIFSMFTVDETINDPARKFFGLEPAGKQFTNEYINTDPARSKYWSMIGVSDQSTAGTFSAKSSRIIGGAYQNVIWAYQDLSGGTPTYTNPYANAIATENSLPGSRNAVWFGATTNANIAGYTDAMSYSPGDTVNFKVDSNNTAFNVEIFRHGFYGYNTFGAKRKATVSGTPAVQSVPTINSFGGTVCAWSTTATWSIPATATPGMYVYNMRRTDNTAFVAQGIFVVKSPVPASQNSQIMLATSEFTWQAYNVWGARTDTGIGYSGYTGRSLYAQAPANAITGRSFAVSFDRPIGTIGANAASYYWESEGSLVNFLEGNGYDIAYFASTDIEKNSVIPSRFKVAVVSGHSEYWTDNLRDGYENARAAGTNLMFLSSNTSLWRVRFAAGDTNKRTMICYKDSHDTVGYDGTTKYDPTSYTGTWRDSRTTPGGVNNTVQRPEPALGGQWFIGNGPFTDRIAVTNTHGSLPIWRNTRVATGGTITYRGSASAVLTTAATSINYTQPSGTQIGDLVVSVLVFNSNPGVMGDNNMRLVRQTVDGTSQYTYIYVGYAGIAGTAGGNFSWSSNAVASLAMNFYGGAVWWDTDAAIKVDTGNTTLHTTRSITNAGANMWAVCAFGDTTVSSSTKTTTWTAGTGLTSRVTVNNSASGAGPWNSAALMDTNGSVTQAAHQYSATAQFANAHAAAAIMYISPGTSLYAGTIGYEWDYVKSDEPTTPYNLVMLSQQPLSLASQASNYNGDGYANTAIHKYGMSLFKDNTSGAWVFNAGTWRYQWGISRTRASAIDDVTASVDVAMQQAIINILKDMGVSYGALLDTTANADATALVDPGSAATATSYGLTVVSATTYSSIFPSSRVPSTNLSNSNDGIDYTFGTVFSSSSNGKIYGIKWYFPDYLPNDHVVGLLYSWTSNTVGTELARVTFTNTQSGWNQALFTSPIDITANTKYVAAVWTIDRYVTVSGQFGSAVTNGDLTAPADTTGVHNGKLKSGVGAASYPDSSNSANGYLADVLYTAGGIVTFEGWGIPIN